MHATNPFLRRWEQMRFLFRTKFAMPRQIRGTLRRLARKRTPILLGPWLSEVGFELLYWIPFVRHFFHEYGIAPERVVAISRGGAEPWYSAVARGYFEIFDLYSPQEFLEKNRQRELQGGIKKQMSLTEFDRTILDEAATRLDLGDYDVVHPSWMYQLFSSYWGGWMHIDRLCSWCDHSPLCVDLARPREIPFTGDYAAAKFYFSDCFPDTPANRSFIRSLLERTIARMPVVLLNTGLKVDDHDDVGGQQAPTSPLLKGRDGGVFDATPLMKPANNLALQTAIVANASLLLSTYGGFSYLGPLLNKPTLSFWSKPNFLGSHLALAHEVLNRDAQQFLAVLPTGSAELLWELGGVRVERAA